MKTLSLNNDAVNADIRSLVTDDCRFIMKDDAISRLAAIDAVRKCSVKEVTPAFMLVDKAEVMTELMMLSSAQSEQQYGRVFKGIVVEYPLYNTYPKYKGKPYFSIKYTENGQEFIGYGTYKPEVLSEYLKEYFMPSAQPEQLEIIRCQNDK